MKAKNNELTVESMTQRYSLGHKALSVALSVVLMGFGWPAVSPSQVYAGDGEAADDAAAQVEGASPQVREAMAFIARTFAGYDGSELGVARHDVELGDTTCVATGARFADGVLSVHVNMRYPASETGQELLARAASAAGAAAFRHMACPSASVSHAPLSRKPSAVLSAPQSTGD